MAYKDLVEEILKKVGGKENGLPAPHSLYYSFTFQFKDESIADTGALKKNERCSYSSTKWWTISSSHRKPRTEKFIKNLLTMLGY